MANGYWVELHDESGVPLYFNKYSHVIQRSGPSGSIWDQTYQKTQMENDFPPQNEHFTVLNKNWICHSVDSDDTYINTETGICRTTRPELELEHEVGELKSRLHDEVFELKSRLHNLEDQNVWLLLQ